MLEIVTPRTLSDCTRGMFGIEILRDVVEECVFEHYAVYYISYRHILFVESADTVQITVSNNATVQQTS